MILEKYKKLIGNNLVIFQNLKYMTILELFVVVSPLITYPYLTKTLGSEVFGLVITASIIASFAIIFVNFGFRNISAKDVSIHRDNREKLSEIVSSIFIIRICLWIISFAIYSLIVFLTPLYNEHMSLFLLSFGVTFNNLLFPHFFFQGIEKMKFITFIDVIIRTTFIVLIFIFVRNQADYILVPLFKLIGFLGGGVISLYVIFFKEKISFKIPDLSILKSYIIDALPIFSTQIISSIKDKVSYVLLGAFVGMHEVVIYDLGYKFTQILSKPSTIIGRVFLPKIAKERNIKLFRKLLLATAAITIFSTIILNIFLPSIVDFFIDQQIQLFPLRIFLLAPLFLALSSLIASNNIIALGYYKYILYSIIVTTITYSVLTLLMYSMNMLQSVLVFVIITVAAYLTELIYRLYASHKIIKKEKSRLQ